MAFEWTEQRIRWYWNAAQYTGFHHQLAQKIKPLLTPQDTVCDLGCGLGCLDFELASMVKHITCIDVDTTVLGHLQDYSVRTGIHNLTVLCQNAHEVHSRYDVVLMAFFGTPAKLMLHAISLSSRLLIRIINADDANGFFPHKGTRCKRETVLDVRKALDSHKYRYRYLEEELDFGQPFCSCQDAINFLSDRNPSQTAAEITHYLSKTLQATGNPNFPFYLPKSKKLGIFIVDTAPD